jgi:hypothetical protein
VNIVKTAYKSISFLLTAIFLMAAIFVGMINILEFLVPIAIVAGGLIIILLAFLGALFIYGVLEENHSLDRAYLLFFRNRIYFFVKKYEKRIVNILLAVVICSFLIFSVAKMAVKTLDILKTYNKFESELELELAEKTKEIKDENIFLQNRLKEYEEKLKEYEEEITQLKHQLVTAESELAFTTKTNKDLAKTIELADINNTKPLNFASRTGSLQ